MSLLYGIFMTFLGQHNGLDPPKNISGLCYKWDYQCMQWSGLSELFPPIHTPIRKMIQTVQELTGVSCQFDRTFLRYPLPCACYEHVVKHVKQSRLFKHFPNGSSTYLLLPLRHNFLSKHI